MTFSSTRFGALGISTLAVVAVTCGGPRAARIAPAIAPPPVTVAATPSPVPLALPAPVEASGDAAFERTVRPILFRTCTPCHAPGGQMYGRMPFDSPSVVRDHRAGILRRLKGDDRATLEAWLAGGS